TEAAEHGGDVAAEPRRFVRGGPGLRGEQHEKSENAHRNGKAAGGSHGKDSSNASGVGPVGGSLGQDVYSNRGEWSSHLEIPGAGGAVRVDPSSWICSFPGGRNPPSRRKGQLPYW